MTTPAQDRWLAAQAAWREADREWMAAGYTNRARRRRDTLQPEYDAALAAMLAEAPAFNSELTAAGEQLVVPGTEQNATKASGQQGELWG